MCVSKTASRHESSAVGAPSAPRPICARKDGQHPVHQVLVRRDPPRLGANPCAPAPITAASTRRGVPARARVIDERDATEHTSTKRRPPPRARALAPPPRRSPRTRPTRRSVRVGDSNPRRSRGRRAPPRVARRVVACFRGARLGTSSSRHRSPAATNGSPGVFPGNRSRAPAASRYGRAVSCASPRAIETRRTCATCAARLTARMPTAPKRRGHRASVAVPPRTRTPCPFPNRRRDDSSSNSHRHHLRPPLGPAPRTGRGGGAGEPRPERPRRASRGGGDGISLIARRNRRNRGSSRRAAPSKLRRPGKIQSIPSTRTRRVEFALVRERELEEREARVARDGMVRARAAAILWAAARQVQSGAARIQPPPPPPPRRRRPSPSSWARRARTRSSRETRRETRVESRLDPRRRPAAVRARPEPAVGFVNLLANRDAYANVVDAARSRSVGDASTRVAMSVMSDGVNIADGARVARRGPAAADGSSRSSDEAPSNAETRARRANRRVDERRVSRVRAFDEARARGDGERRHRAKNAPRRPRMSRDEWEDETRASRRRRRRSSSRVARSVTLADDTAPDARDAIREGFVRGDSNRHSDGGSHRVHGEGPRPPAPPRPSRPRRTRTPSNVRRRAVRRRRQRVPRRRRRHGRRARVILPRV